jgi:hypothetical protein
MIIRNLSYIIYWKIYLLIYNQKEMN